MAQVDSGPASISLDPQVKENEEHYMGLLVKVSLLLVSKDFPLEVQCHGAKMIKHLLEIRCEDLSRADLLNLNLALVKSPNEDHTLRTADPGEQTKHASSLLLLSVNNSSRSSAAEETVDGHAPITYFGSRTKSEYTRLIYISESDKSNLSSSSSTTSGTRSDGTRSETGSWWNSESSKSSNLSCMRSFVLPFDDQVDYDESELEVQRLMSIDMFENDEVDGDPEDQVVPKDHDDFGNRITISKKVADIVHPRMLGLDGKAYSHQVKACLLFAEHNILWEAFVIISRLRDTMYKGILPWLLNPLNVIWTQPDWESTFLSDGFGLSCLFSDGSFLKMVYNVVKFYEDELKRSIEEDFTEKQSYDTSSVSLHLFLPLLLQLLRCIHALWKAQIACNLSEELEKAKALNCEEDSQQNNARKLLDEIRECGYRIIGLCMSLNGAFDELLDCSYLTVTFIDFDSMEFRHLSKLIHLVLLPLVKSCPRKFWKEWMLNLLGPILEHCEDVLYYAWFSLLHEGRAKVSYYFGKLPGSAESIQELEHTILLQFTRDVSQIFGSSSSPELNSGLSRKYFEDVSNEKMTSFQDLESLASYSLIGYLLINGCFGRLRMSLFGYWVDDEAATKAIPFCRTLVQLAGVSKDEGLRLFVSDELLPSVIKRLDDQLPCAIRHLSCKLNVTRSDNVNRDLTILSQELYNYLSSNFCSRSQNLVAEYKDRENAADDFTCWLAKLKEDFYLKACCAAPEEFIGMEVEWNWEFEDEFRRYLPVYIDMLKEVDAMDNTLELDYLDNGFLLQKLRPEFKLKYAINDMEHPHLRTISDMRRRKFNSMIQVINHKTMFEILSKLIDLTPYIKGSNYPYSVIDHLEQNPEALPSTFDAYDVEESVHFLIDSVLHIWEPQFHPLIREGHKDLLLWIIGQLTKAKEFEDFKPLAPEVEDFLPHLRPYAMFYILTKLKTSLYTTAEVQLHMHEEYDDYLASGKLDDYIYESMRLEGNFYEKDLDSWAVPHQFSDLDHGLIKLSLKRRAAIVQIDRQVRAYLNCLRCLMEDDLRKDRLTNLMSELEAAGFFDIDNCRINWEKKHFTELVDKVSIEVFAEHSLPRHYVIRGIIDYRTITLWRDRTQRSFEQVVGEACERLTAYLPQFWRDTRHYTHNFYEIVREPLEKLFV
ncbi:hypothetical protein SEVIR_7G027500v4 [Setaria viridis]|uniref:Exportin-5 C-terminal domain-containing protein n=3 Tax=Setaria TaxID=4554 RepID=A0A368RRM3_SETIT|nr:uncharacterized protein LOC101780865 isoform X1 [Setaria italica]XP_022683842.1 uncharacterized protein LOC101780865 isoform X1 [Setaria italica]XP_034602920.1 uncharacterized protein LOC117863365 isoform X1 [Setaria viridis]XP_034602921.1 uncharacterized protein LOC117863365 isoform X1 [Setaria viridis]RCV32896.1 hypothetical protein SETIT_7G040000v2 [Setaria italica]RCV32897.1 hypothetical protein SETIT_7G040000v2 [Setaria italica]TKW03485.1 hypothetical protein SEVIR_7G027500v2 [Setaria